MTTTRLEESWEERFDEIIGGDFKTNSEHALVHCDYCKNKLKRFIAQELTAQKKELIERVEKEIKQFQSLYGNFNSSTGYLMGYKTDENGTDPTDILILKLKALLKIKDEV